MSSRSASMSVLRVASAMQSLHRHQEAVEHAVERLRLVEMWPMAGPFDLRARQLRQEVVQVLRLVVTGGDHDQRGTVVATQPRDRVVREQRLDDGNGCGPA